MTERLVKGLVEVWNNMIQQSEFQFFSQEMKTQMVALNSEHAGKQPL